MAGRLHDGAGQDAEGAGEPRGRLGGEAGAPGTVVAAGKQGIEVACGEGTLRILRAQVEGRKPLGAAELTGGRTLAAGMVLGGSPPTGVRGAA